MLGDNPTYSRPVTHPNPEKDGQDTPQQYAAARKWFELGEARWQDESKAPPVERELLRAYARCELPDELRARIMSLAMRFRSWWKALCAAEAAEEAGRN